MLDRRAMLVALAWAAMWLLALEVLESQPVQAQQPQFPWNSPDAQSVKKAPPTEPKKNPPAASVDSQADLLFWNSVKDRGKPDELRAYLKQFPNGRFAELARLRLKEAEAAPADTGAAANADAASQTILREVQERLYKLNYPITRFDGSVDDATDRVIKAWQVKHEFAPSGVLSVDQLKVLRSIVPADSWGAVAHPVVGVATAVHSKKSRQEAESEALAACKASNGVACKVQAAPADECIAVATFRAKIADGRTVVSHLYARQSGIAAATRKVVQNCAVSPQRAGNPCSLVGVACGTSAASAEQLKKLLPPDPTLKQPLPQPKKDQDT